MSRPLIGKNRKSTRYRVEFPTIASFQVQPEYVELKQEHGKHDVLILQYPSNRGDFFTFLKTGVPVKVSWTQGARTRVWYGYVSVTKALKAAQKKRPTRVYCIGASFLMKNSTPRVFKNTTIPEVAERVAREFGLTFTGENTSHRWEQVSISGNTYWEWLQDSAERIGYACYVDGMNLVFRPMNKLLEQNKSDLPILQYWALPIVSKKFGLDRTLDSIELKSGDYLEDTDMTRSDKQLGGVDPVTGKTFLERKSPRTSGKSLRGAPNGVLFDEHQVHGVAHSKNWGKSLVESSAILSKFNMPAKLIGQGDPRIHPLSMVYVDGTGPETDGTWLVKKVVHKLNRGGEYSVEIDAYTDGTGASLADFAAPISVASYPEERSSVGKIDIDQYLASATFSSSAQQGTKTVKLPSKGLTPSDTAVLRSKVDVNKLIKNKTTTAKPGLAKSPHVWTSPVPGRQLKSGKAR